MLPATLDQYLHRTWQVFNANFGSLRLFGEQIAQVADRLDRQSVHEIAEVMADVFDEPVVQVEAELLEFIPSLDDLEIYPNVAENPDVREALELLKDHRFKRKLMQWAIDNPRDSYKLTQAWADYFSQPPANGILLRRSALVSLVGAFEILLEALFFGHYIYAAKEGLIEEAEVREQMARKQAESAMKSNTGWRGRIERFGELGVDLGPVRDYLDEFVEVTQRRNLIVHNEGVIDANYMKWAPSAYRPAEAREGLMLVVSTRYLHRAFDVILLLAFGLSQACWRQWCPEENKKQANRAVETLIYQNLRHGHYELVQDLAMITEQVSLPWRFRQLVLVNAAIAWRERGNKANMQPIVTRLKKKQCGWQTKIALAVLQEDFLGARRLMKQAADKGRLHQAISPYWPLFEPIKSEAWFKHLFDVSEHDKVPRKRK